jgi:hypothetical protein
MSRLQKKPPAHKRGHPTLQNMNFFYFCGSFLPSWIPIRIRIQITDPDPDPMVRLNTDPIRIRIRNPAQLPTTVRGGAESFKGLSHDEGRKNLAKKSPSLFL